MQIKSNILRLWNWFVFILKANEKSANSQNWTEIKKFHEKRIFLSFFIGKTFQAHAYNILPAVWCSYVSTNCIAVNITHLPRHSATIKATLCVWYSVLSFFASPKYSINLIAGNLFVSTVQSPRITTIHKRP